MRAMSDAEFKSELASRGFSVVIPERGSDTPWGYIDIGDGVMVNRWDGGNTLESQLAFCVKTKQKLAGKCDATICSSRWVKSEPEQPPKVATAVKKVAKKAVKKVAKKGGKR